MEKEQAEERKNECEPPLQPPGLADSYQLPHDQSQVETTSVDQQPLQDVVPSFQMHASHAAGFVHVGHTAFRQFTSLLLQLFAARPPNPPPVGVYLFLLVLFPFPVPPTPLRLRNV